jgi:hypothetical protein
MNTVPATDFSNPVLTLPTTAIEQTTQPSRLAEIIASSRKRVPTLAEWLTDVRELLVAKPAWTTPTVEVIPKLSRAVRRAQILAKRDEVVNQARQAFIRAAYPEITALSANGFQGLHCLTSQRLAEAAELDKKTTIADEVVDFLAADIKAKAERAAKRAHASLLAAPRRKKAVVNDEHLEEIKARLSAEVNEWKEAHARRVVPKEGQRQAALEERFTGFTNWCPSCFEYVEQKHEQGRDCEVRQEKKALAANKAERELAVYNAKWTANNNRKLAARGWVGYGNTPITQHGKTTNSPTELIAGIEVPSMSAGLQDFVTFVGDGRSLEVIEVFNHSPRANRSHQRAEDLFEAAQSWKKAAVVVGPACLRCNAPITKRKGTKFCSKNCCNRHGEGTYNKGVI